MFAKLVLIGNVGQDPEYSFNERTGETYINFSVAVTSGKDDKKRTEWYSCTAKADSNAAKFCSDYVRSGDKVYIEGYPTINSYMNKERQIVSNISCWINQINIVASKKPPTNTNNNTEEVHAVLTEEIPVDDKLASIPVAEAE